jgi:hypothetical protein
MGIHWDGLLPTTTGLRGGLSPVSLPLAGPCHVPMLNLRWDSEVQTLWEPIWTEPMTLSVSAIFSPQHLHSGVWYDSTCEFPCQNIYSARKSLIQGG